MTKLLKFTAISLCLTFALWLPSDLSDHDEIGLTGVASAKAVTELPETSHKALTTLDPVPVTPEDYVRLEAKKYGWSSGREWADLKTLINNESGWRTHAMNKDSAACGLFQALPCSKLGTSLDDVAGQARWGLNYISNRYGSPSRALSFWYAQSPHWY